MPPRPSHTADRQPAVATRGSKRTRADPLPPSRPVKKKKTTANAVVEQQEDAEDTGSEIVVSSRHTTIQAASAQPNSMTAATLAETDTANDLAFPLFHDRDMVWGGSIPYTTTSSSTTSNGGRVHRIYDSNRRAIDGIICTPSSCSICTPTSTLTTLTNTSNSLPFLHSVDIRKQGDSFLFEPKRDVAFDRQNSPVTDSVKRKVVYGDEKIRVTRVCVYQKCRVCAVEALLRTAE